jgi:uncharacterized protein (DUF427 family)
MMCTKEKYLLLETTFEDIFMNAILNVTGNKPESVWKYPRRPKVEQITQAIKVEFNGKTIAESSKVIRVLEKGHPPVYYVPLEDVNIETLQVSARKTWCEWKGEAGYYDVLIGDRRAENAAWYYPNPLPDYAEIKGYVAFYASKMEACFVGDERVEPQRGGFYGGWITSNLDGPFKGDPGTAGW